ncbi:hypothetical protein Hdeb2414_s0203g00831201 [Helianthus debilis subsp. tardiflorus]
MLLLFQLIIYFDLILQSVHPRLRSRQMLFGPFKFGYYSPGTAPNRIPHRLYLLVKEVVDIMKTHNDPKKALATVERKIHFFCNYFHSHLPYHGWEYRRDNASTIVNRYRLKRGPEYNMAGYIPFSLQDLKVWKYEYDSDTNLARRDMINVMSIIHSRKTPAIWRLGAASIIFYCKICSCFGIDYRRLEGASEDDVCLMKSISLEEEEEEEEEEERRAMAAEIIYAVCSQRTPITMNWDEYAISFYLKMCTCFGVDSKLSEDDCQKNRF